MGAKIKHGLFFENKKMPLFYLHWIKMRQRCYNQNNRGYKYFGGKGIRICKRWDDFRNFQEDMHDKYLSAIKTFGKNNFCFCREDDNKDFSPENCGFFSKKYFWNKMSRKKSKIFVNFNGEKVSVSRLNHKLGHNIGYRIMRGIKKEYLFCDKLPFNEKHHPKKTVLLRKFFIDNRKTFQNLISKRNFEIFNYRFGEEMHSLRETGKKFNLTGQRILQIIKLAFLHCTQRIKS